jgi:hypothetical protein
MSDYPPNINVTYKPEPAPQQTKNKKAIKKLLQRAGNEICADCPNRSPRWASINLGIFICVPCAAVHRRIGTHISKVKSTNLDEWNTHWIEHVKTWGNLNANAYWEAEIPERYKRPDGQHAAETEKFIR